VTWERDNADVLAFLRAGLNTAEREWPRFRAELRPVRDVPMGELRTHPDLVERMAALVPGEGWVLMGGAVLADAASRIYAVALGTHTAVFRAGAGAAGDVGETAETPVPPSMGGGVFALPGDWVAVNPWKGVTASIDELRRLAVLARDRMD
jgi:hypothetical protein